MGVAVGPAHGNGDADAFLSRLFIAEACLPETPRRAWSPEQRLAFAVLQDALVCALRGRPLRNAQERGGSAPTAALAWILSPEAAWPFSFLGTCDALDLVPGPLRRGILRYLATRRALPRQRHEVGEHGGHRGLRVPA